MHSLRAIAIFLAAVTVASLVWGRALWYLAERSPALRRWVFFLMGFTRRPMAQVKSMLLGTIYCGLGLLAAGLFAYGFNLPVAGLIVPLKPIHLALAMLGAAGEISLTNLLVDLICRLPGVGGPQRLAEMNDVPWIKGVRQLPARMAPLAAALGGMTEELFFRGVVQRILTDRLLVPALVAILIAGILFYFEQVLQVQTVFQAVVIGCSCVAISAIGGLLVVLTGSIGPAIFAHASFVLFFMAQGSQTAAAPQQNSRGMASR
jgi:membrane protease YdiL (CAAX protease family)